VGVTIQNFGSENGSDCALTFRESGGDSAGIRFYGTAPITGRRTVFYDYRSGATMSFRSLNGEVIRIEGGHIGLGPWSPHIGPSSLLHVRGDGTTYGGVDGWPEVVAAFEESGDFHTAVSVNGETGQDAIVYLAEGGSAYWSLRHDSSDSHKLSLRYLDGGVSWITPVTIDSLGRVGIGMTTPEYPLDVAGDIQCVALHQTSDAALKTDVRPLDHPLEMVQKIPAVSFRWRDEASAVGAKPGDQAIGVLAQDVEAVLPEAVSSPLGSHKSVNYAELTALLIGAVQELTQRNACLEARVAELESLSEHSEQ
jgi:hypothetical protein